MPPRSLVALILCCWLASTAWFFYRDVWPDLGNDNPPPYTIDLTEEVTANSVGWEVFQNDQRIGLAQSQVIRLPDRTFELRSLVRFERFKVLQFDVVGMHTTYQVTAAGRLVALGGKVIVREASPRPMPVELSLGFGGTVVDGFLEPRIEFNGAPVDDLKLDKVPMTQGSVLNPMHPINRLPGLSAGQRWRILLFEPINATLDGVFGTAGLKQMTIPSLQAEVVDGTLEWAGQEVSCHKIEYRESASQPPVAATWVRKQDGLVLQQDASYGAMALKLRRDPVIQ